MRPRMCGDLIGPGGVSRPGEVRRGQAVSRSGGQEVGRSGGREVRRSAGQEVRRSGGQPVSRSAGQILPVGLFGAFRSRGIDEATMRGLEFRSRGNPAPATN